MSQRLIFHVDINSAFLSWTSAERVKNGESDLRLVPSVIGGDPEKRTSIVAAKSIPAKKYGINTGEPVSMALRKCPQLIVARGDFDLYVRCSRAFKSICQEYTPAMESFSIDEVFMDMTGMEKLYPDPLELADTIKNRIRDELGFTANVGVARNKLCAKMASDFEKPDRVHTLFPEEIEKKMWPLPVEDLFTCGKTTAAKLRANNIRTIGELAAAGEDQLKYIVGERSAGHLHRYANGIDDSEVSARREDAKGYSAETTFEEDITEIDDICRVLRAQADVVAARIRSDNARCRCVAVSYRTADFVNRSHQSRFKDSTDVTDEIYDKACSLMKEFYAGEPVRLIGLAVTDIDREGFEQLSLIPDEHKEKLKKLDMAMDSIRTRYGNDSVMRASTADLDGRINRMHKAKKAND